MTDHIETVPMTIDIKVGTKHELNLRTEVVEEFDRIYFTATAGGAARGLVEVTQRLLKLIPEDAPLAFQQEKAALTD